jgi:hypothetical protein
MQAVESRCTRTGSRRRPQAQYACRETTAEAAADIAAADSRNNSEWRARENGLIHVGQLGLRQMNDQPERARQRDLLRPPDDVFLGIVVEIAVGKWRGSSGVEPTASACRYQFSILA